MATKWQFPLVVTLLLVGVFSSKSGYNASQHDPPYQLYRSLTTRTFNHIRPQNVELVICHKSLAEYFTFYSGVDALPWLPEYKIEPEKLWRIASSVPESAFKNYFSEADRERIHSIGIGYWLLPEAVWRAFIERLETAEEAELLAHLRTWKNPYAIRPSYLLNRKK